MTSDACRLYVVLALCTVALATALAADTAGGAGPAGHPDLDPYVVYLDLPRVDPTSPPARSAGAAWAKARRAEVTSGAAPVLARLGEFQPAGRVAEPRLLWVVRAISLRLDPALVPWVEGLPGVRAVKPDVVLPDSADGWMGDAAPAGAAPMAGPNPHAQVTTQLMWLNVDYVWTLGVTGQGVLIASLDSGVDHTHPDLADHIWANPGEVAGDGTDNDGNGKIDDVRGWDFKLNGNDPVDDENHGTPVAGLALGDGTGGIQTGAAPDATLMILRRGDRQSTFWDAIQYAVEEGADLIVLARTWNWARTPRPDYAGWREATDSALSAGVLMLASAGNMALQQQTNPIPYNINAPSNSPPPFLHVEQAGEVGGLSAVLTAASADDPTLLAALSSRGPSEWTDIKSDSDPTYPYAMPPPYRDYPYWGGARQGLLKPDVALPGNGSTAPWYSTAGQMYGNFNGTSAATGHLAGIAALMLSARPGATPPQLARCLYQTAIDKPFPGWPAGWDPGWGSGFVDALAAVQCIQTFCDASGGDADTDAVCQPADNCQAVSNPTQRDQDGDLLGDACDPCPLDADDDADADGACADVDNCPAIANPLQENADLDGAGDACDCAPANGAVWRKPGEALAGVRISGDKQTLTWPTQPDAEAYNVFRGVIAPGQPFAYGYTCLAQAITTTHATDRTVPPARQAYYYLLQSTNCFGTGSLGAASDGTQRPAPGPCT